MLPIHVVDAFTDRPFAGNPAGVCPLPAGDRPDEVRTHRVAAELCHSETAFALPGRDRLLGLRASPRTGLGRTEVRGDHVHLTGDAVTVRRGELV